MYVIAVTGGMGSGKSVACERFRSKGAIVLDLDAIAKQVVEPGTPVYDRVVARFGDGIIGDEGRIDRSKLADIVFADADELEDLNRIVHPAVLKEVVEGITSLRLMEQPPRIVVLEVPLLARVPVFADVADTALAIEAPVELRLRRAVDAGMDPMDAARRISHQASDEERAALAEHVVLNDGTIEEFEARLDEFWDGVAPRGA